MVTVDPSPRVRTATARLATAARPSTAPLAAARLATVALVLLLFAGLASPVASDAAQSTPPQRSQSHPPGLPNSGPNALGYRCRGTWAPIQAKVSGFVIGNCRGGTPVSGIATDECAAGCIRGAKSEGGGWQAVRLPRSAGFPACGWMNMKNRLIPGGRPATARCDAPVGPDLTYLQGYVKRFAGRRVAGAPWPSTEKYRGLYVWAGRFTQGPRRGQEGGGERYVPRLGASPSRSCTAYANIEPWHPGARTRPSEAMWTVHDGSRNLDIRYLARFQARTARGGDLRWWVNVHSRSPADRAQPWGFISATCLFGKGATGRAAGTRPAPRRDARAIARRHRMDARRASQEQAEPRCGFDGTGLHVITDRRELTCAQAKAALRDLRGDHVLAPMSCGTPRRLGGWRLTSVVRDPSLASARYASPSGSFVFRRHAFPDNLWCGPPR